MSQENVEIVRRAFAAFEEGDVSQMLDLATDDLITYRADPDRAEYHGKEGFFEVTADWIEGFRDWSVTAEEFMDAGRAGCLVQAHQAAHGEGSGVPVEGDVWFVFEIRGRKISKLSFYVRKAEALETAGLRE